jgi:hypothetical protein
MASEGTRIPGPNDMVETWRKAAADAEQRWNDFFNELMGTEAFGQIMARSMDGFLSFQSTMASGMEQYLRAFNLPSRSDLTMLAERVAMLEQKIDALASLLERERLPARGDTPNGSRAPSRSRRAAK